MSQHTLPLFLPLQNNSAPLPFTHTPGTWWLLGQVPAGGSGKGSKGIQQWLL